MKNNEEFDLEACRDVWQRHSDALAARLTPPPVDVAAFGQRRRGVRRDNMAHYAMAVAFALALVYPTSLSARTLFPDNKNMATTPNYTRVDALCDADTVIAAL